MKWWGGRNQEDRVGFYTTLVFHLAILVILLAFSVGRVATQEQSFVLDFTKQEELEKLQKEIELKEEVNKNLEDLLARQPRERIRNVAVDAANSTLRVATRWRSKPRRRPSTWARRKGRSRPNPPRRTRDRRSFPMNWTAARH